METSKRNLFEFILGLILLIPPLLGVVAFLLRLITKFNLFSGFLNHGVWSGGFVAGGTLSQSYSVSGFTAALPLYLGLMAIAGAYLIKDTKK